MSLYDIFSLCLYALGILIFGWLTVHYFRVRDGIARIGLILTIGGLFIGQITNLIMLLARVCNASIVSSIRQLFILTEIIVLIGGGILLSVVILQTKYLTKKRNRGMME